MLIYLGLATAHAMLAPTGYTGLQNAPDEAAHLVYVRTLAAGHLPVQAAAAADPNGYEWHQGPLYYALAVPLLRFGDRGPRFASVACGLAALLLLYALARTLFPQDRPLAVAALGIAALTPGHVTVTSVVSNDALTEVCFTGALLLLVGALQKEMTPGRALLLGATLGLGLLTKATGLLLLPVTIAAFALLLLRSSPKTVLHRAALTLGSMLLLGGPWLLRNHALYGEWLPLDAFRRSFAGTAQANDMQVQAGGWGSYLELVARWTFQSFWAVYGLPQSGDARIGRPRFLPESLYGLLAMVTLVGMAGLACAHLRRARDFTGPQRQGLWLLFGAIGLVGLAFLGFILHYFQAQGRYFYPVMAPLGISLALGWRYALPRRYFALASGLLFAVLGLCSVALLLRVAS